MQSKNTHAESALAESALAESAHAESADDGRPLPALLFTDGVLDPHACGDRRTADILTAAAQRVLGRLRPSDVLHAVLESADPAILPALDVALAEGAAPSHLLDTLDVYSPAGGAYDFDGSPDRIAPELLAAFADAGAQWDAYEKASRPPPAVLLELLLACVLDHPDEQDRAFLGVLDLPLAVRSLRQRVRIHTEPLPELYDDTSGRLRSEEFTADAWAVLEEAARRAAELGYDRLLPPHCLLALLAETEGLAERLLRLQLPPHVGLVKATETISGAFRLSERGREEPPRLHRDETGEALVTTLGAARRVASLWDAERIDTPHLLAALLDDPPPRLTGVLRAEPLLLDPDRLRDHLREVLRASRSSAPREIPYRLPSHLPPSEDLTWLARTGGIAPARHLDAYFDPLCRAMHRTEHHHVLLTGPPGVGTSTLLRELARRAAEGEIPFLRKKRFLRVDCRDVAADRSGEQLAALVGQVAGRTDLVVCLDGLGPLLRGPHGTDHVLELRRALAERRIQLVGVLAAHDYEDLIGADHALQEMTTRIDIVEPDREAAADMVRCAADALESEFDVGIEDRAVARAVVLAGDFIAHQKLPLSAVRVLRRACEDLDYAREQEGAERQSVSVADVVDVVAELSRVPRGQIAGSAGERADHAAALRARVVGQEYAIRVVSEELRRIKAGLAGAQSGPASVLLFAGLTGVGKTELAKAVAGLYSASKRLQTYPMENFTEPHSVAGIIGSPPGYVGHDRGGRLINELNADPYCVFLLDEAEKAHPEVLRPFLNLFDEGWITDQRGVKAHGDRAIFILTTNEGHDTIAGLGAGHTDEEASAIVRSRLADVRGGRHHEPVFTPELLARIRRIVVFRPLDLAAMTGIAHKLLERQRAFWRDKREKELVVPDALVTYAAALGHRRNTDAAGREGGRIMARVFSDLVENPVLAAAEDDPVGFQDSARIVLDFTASGTPKVNVAFEAEPSARVEQSYEAVRPAAHGAAKGTAGEEDAEDGQRADEAGG